MKEVVGLLTHLSEMMSLHQINQRRPTEAWFPECLVIPKALHLMEEPSSDDHIRQLLAAAQVLLTNSGSSLLET